MKYTWLCSLLPLPLPRPHALSPTPTICLSFALKAATISVSTTTNRLHELFQAEKSKRFHTTTRTHTTPHTHTHGTHTHRLYTHTERTTHTLQALISFGGLFFYQQQQQLPQLQRQLWKNGKTGMARRGKGERWGEEATTTRALQVFLTRFVLLRMQIELLPCSPS